MDYSSGLFRITTDLDTLKYRSNAVISLMHMSSIFCIANVVCANKIISSAYKLQPTNRPWSQQPKPLDFTFCTNPSMYTANSSGDNMPPWRTPAHIWKTRDIALLHLTTALHLSYQLTNTFTRHTGTERSKCLLNSTNNKADVIRTYRTANRGSPE